MRLAVGQAASSDDVAANLAQLDDLAGRAAAEGADLLVTPELFTTGYDPERVAGAPSVLPQLQQVAGDHGLALVVSEPFEGTITAAVVDARGRLAGRYVKTHLYGPHERAAFAPGDGQRLVVDVAGTPVGVLVCFDVEFPEAVRGLALAGAELVVVPTAVTVPELATLLVPARAYENRVAVAYANHVGPVFDGTTFSGGSVVVGPDGTVLARAGHDAPELLLADVTPEQVRRAREEVDYLAERRPSAYRLG